MCRWPPAITEQFACRSDRDRKKIVIEDQKKSFGNTVLSRF
jgi:hypothetical protein